MTLIAMEQKITAIAEKLSLSPSTVNIYRAHILRNLAERVMLCRVFVFCSKKYDIAEPLAWKHLQRISNSAEGSVDFFTISVYKILLQWQWKAPRAGIPLARTLLSPA